MLAALACFATTPAHAVLWTVEKDTLMCSTREDFAQQMQYLAEGLQQFAPHCGTSHQPLKVLILDYSRISANKVMLVEDGLTLWVLPNGLRR
jgi:hypothetical protein